MPEQTPLKATVTGTVEGDGFVVENLHYQSVPGLYVTANLYRPSKDATSGEGCRRSSTSAAIRAWAATATRPPTSRTGSGSPGTAMSAWSSTRSSSARSPGVHHGTYREGRWWWHSRGYTPAGVECWNGIRGIDYLVGRPDVDPDRIAVTGISGGGAATFWIAAADDRVKVAVPVSGMADLHSYVANRVVNGHCDCMFLYNTFQWPWTRIAGAGRAAAACCSSTATTTRSSRWTPTSG